jgi:prepilin-type N-terminal cleavage/methylation domain-containing protein
MKKKQEGFTLIELLIVIAIIAVLAGVVFVALNPLKRFQDARDSRRSADVESILSAIKVQQVDNGGAFLTPVNNLASTTAFYMIGDGTSGCDTNCTAFTVASTGACVNLNGVTSTSSLVLGGYMGSIPVSPNGVKTWTASTTGYVLRKASNGIVTIGACENEGDTTPVIQSSK